MKCHMHPEFDADDCVGCKLVLAEEDVDRLRGIVREMREALQGIYRLSGEDRYISSVASPLIDKTRLI